MATEQATLPREPAKRLADFDEQLWPVNVLLLLLAAVVAGLIVGRADFDTRNPWANAYVHLGVLGAIVLVLAVGAAVMRRGHQRRMQLAVLASLLLHLWLSVGMQGYRLPQVASPHPRAPARAHDAVLPDYHFHQLERTSEKQFFEQPLETEAAQPVETPEHERKPPVPKVVPTSKPTPKPLKPEPRPIDIQRADTSAPRRGERLPGPQKATSQQLAEPQPAVVARLQPAADSRQLASQTPESAASRSRPAAELEPRLAMARSPRADRLPELKATPATAANGADVQPAGPVVAPPTARQLARSSTRDMLDTQNVPVVPVAPRTASNQNTSPPGEIGAAATTGRTSRPSAAGLSPPTGLPLAGPGFDGPTMPLGSRVAGSLSSETPDFQQPSLSRPTRAHRDDVLLGGEGAVAGTVGGQPSPAASQAGMAGELEPVLAPRSRGDRSLPISSAGARPATADEELSLGDAPGAPAMRAPAGSTDGPSQAAGPALAVPLRKHDSDAQVDGTVVAAPLASARPAAASGLAQASGPARASSGTSDAATGRVTGPAALPLRSPAPLASGPGERPTVEPGIPSRRARPESNMLATDTPRMILDRSGGELAIDARVRDTAVPGLKQRDRAGRKSIAQQRGGSVETEQAVERGLDFLAHFQAADGSWQLHNPAPGFDYPAAGIPQLNSTTAATGLALLSFLGAGYTHTDGHHRQLVERALNHLLAHQRADGDLFQPQDTLSNSSAWLYSHGIASIAVCEAYGMTRDPRLREPAQRALDFIAAAQNPEEGGWRYAPRRGSDTSVSGWQLMALKSGELAGLKVPRDCYTRMAGWLDHAQGAGGLGSRYAYLPGSDNPAYRNASTVMTAEALLMRQYLGWRRDHPEMIAGAQWLKQNLPQFGTPTAERPTADRNAYYWYYGTQVMFQMQGPYWQAWNSRVRPLLLESQATTGTLAGSWDPVYPLPDRYGYMVGRLYVTTLHLLVLEVYYRHLPIYQTLEQSPGER